MDFLKKYWSKIVLAVLALFGAIVFIVSMANKFDTKAEFPSICFDLMGLVFFLGTIAYLVCKMLDKRDIAKYVLLATGAINFILVCIFLFGNVYAAPGMKITGLELVFGKKGLDAFSVALLRVGLKYNAANVGFAITAALFPLVKGIKKVFCAGSNEAKVAPKAAPAASATAAKK